VLTSLSDATVSQSVAAPGPCVSISWHSTDTDTDFLARILARKSRVSDVTMFRRVGRVGVGVGVRVVVGVLECQFYISHRPLARRRTVVRFIHTASGDAWCRAEPCRAVRRRIRCERTFLRRSHHLFQLNTFHVNRVTAKGLYWVACCKATQFAVAATSHSELSSDEVT